MPNFIRVPNEAAAVYRERSVFLPIPLRTAVMPQRASTRIPNAGIRGAFSNVPARSSLKSSKKATEAAMIESVPRMIFPFPMCLVDGFACFPVKGLTERRVMSVVSGTVNRQVNVKII